MDRKRGANLPKPQTHRPGGEAARGEPMPDSLAQIDPVMQRFQEAPYDELASAAGGGRLIGLGAASISLRGWMRPFAYLVSLSLLVYFAIALDLLMVQILGSHGFERDPYAMSVAALTGIPFGIAGGLLLWRLLTTRRQASGNNAH